MEYEDIDENFEYAGDCGVCGDLLDMSEAGFCSKCGQSFCWGYCGAWYNNKHHCQVCIDAVETDDHDEESDK